MDGWTRKQHRGVRTSWNLPVLTTREKPGSVDPHSTGGLGSHIFWMLRQLCVMLTLEMIVFRALWANCHFFLQVGKFLTRIVVRPKCLFLTWLRNGSFLVALDPSLTTLRTVKPGPPKSVRRTRLSTHSQTKEQVMWSMSIVYIQHINKASFYSKIKITFIITSCIKTQLYKNHFW